MKNLDTEKALGSVVIRCVETAVWTAENVLFGSQGADVNDRRETLTLVNRVEPNATFRFDSSIRWPKSFYPDQKFAGNLLFMIVIECCFNKKQHKNKMLV